MDNEKYLKIRKLMEPLVEYLNENHHPHTKIIIECDGFEIVEGLISGKIEEFIKD